MRRLLHPLENERGASIVLVAFMLAAIMGMAALAIDVGMLYDARAEAQRAADAAALAGAGSLLVSPDEKRARDTAVQYGSLNAVKGVPVELLEEDVDVLLDSLTVRVTVRRTAARGNALETWFARLLGTDEVDIAARAAAAVGSTSSATCLKPWIVPDAWDDRDLDDEFDPGVDYYEPGVTSYGSHYRDGVPSDNGIDPPGTTYVADFGRPVLLKSGDPKMAPRPGWFYPWDVPRADGSPAVGGDRYRWNISHCNPTIVNLGDTYKIENGNMIGPTKQGMEDLIAQDPYAYWDTAGDSVAMSTAPSWEGSSRIVYMPLYDPREEIAPGKMPVTITNVSALFVEEMRGNEVYGRFLFANGLPSGGEVTGENALKFVQLIE